MTIRNYGEFVAALLETGFSGAIGGRDDGVFGLFRYGWGAEDENDVHWHTGDPDTDPWEWRMRVLNERDDISYSKVFFRKAGYITREWAPYFIAARRDGMSFEEEYEDGAVSYNAKRIYDAVASAGSLPFYEIKRIAGFKREENSKFEGALTELQMKMYLTICGFCQRVSQVGAQYGWFASMYSTTERFWGGDVFARADAMDGDDAADAITERIYRVNPAAQADRIYKFIYG